MNAVLKQYGEWIYRMLVLLGLLVIGWLNQNYASRAEVHLLGERVQGIETALKVMAESAKVNDRQDANLVDHENRLRTLEHKIR